MNGLFRQTPLRYPLYAYYFTLGLMLWGTISPSGRMWGVNSWSYFSTGPVVVIGTLLVIAPLLIWFVLSRQMYSSLNDPNKNRWNKFTLFTFALMIVAPILFYYFRATTHFGGDGYTYLSMFTESNPVLKLRNAGEMYSHWWLYQALGGGKSAALQSYQFISYLSGIAFVAITGFLLVRNIEDKIRAWLVFPGLLLGGYTILFFGYVENYSIFVVSVLLYISIGIGVINGKYNRWWILLPQIIAPVLHVFGIAFIPVTAYLLVRRTKWAHLWTRQLFSKRLVIAGLIMLTFLIVFYNLRANSHFFKFSFLPIVSDRFTISGYTIFSVYHIFDFVNLLFLLVPSVMVLSVGVFSKAGRAALKKPVILFLSLTTLCCLAMIFILDPKLGMPRDWDLFSFASVPLTVLLFYMIPEWVKTKQQAFAIGLLALLLSLSTLAARVGIQTNDYMALKREEHQISLDKLRNRNTRISIADYYKSQGDTLRAEKESKKWRDGLTETPYILRANQMISEGRNIEAIKLLQIAIQKNPMYAVSYSNIAGCYSNMGMLDSALTMQEIANGLNPQNATIIHNLGFICFRRGELDRAEKMISNAIEIDSTYVEAYMSLLRVYRAKRDRIGYENLLLKTTNLPDAPLEIVYQQVDYFLSKGRFPEGIQALKQAIKLGLDTAAVNKIILKYPGIAKAFSD